MATAQTTRGSNEDLFLGQNFDPFPRQEISLSRDRIKKAHLICEAEVEAEPKEVSDGLGHHFVYNEQFRRQVGRTVAKHGDDLYNSHQSKAKQQDSSETPWLGVSGQVKGVVSSVVDLEKRGADPQQLEQEKERAWDEFKGIMKNSVADTNVADSYKTLGAVLLTLRGLSDLPSGTMGYVHSLYTRYISETELNNVFQRQWVGQILNCKMFLIGAIYQM